MAGKTLLMLAPIFIVLFASPACLGDSILYSGETLYAGQYLSYGHYSFIIQNDCNLVLYDLGNPIWASNTGGLGRDCHVTLEKNGDLVVYKQNNGVVWRSNSGGENGFYVLIVQKDRNVVIYGGAIWATATNAANGGILAGTAQNSTNTGSTAGAAARA